MNLYKFHSDPKSLIHHDEAHELVPKLFVHDHFGSVTFPRKMSSAQLSALSKDVKMACTYAKTVLKRRWPEAEAILKTDDNLWVAYVDYFDLHGKL